MAIVGTMSASSVEASESPLVVINNVAETSAQAGTTVTGSKGYTVSVVGTYSYVNARTLKTSSVNKNAGALRNVSVWFTAPTNCRTVKLYSQHTASLPGEQWSATRTNVR